MWKFTKTSILVGSDQVEDADCKTPLTDEKSSGLINQRFAMFHCQSPSLEVIPNRLVAHRAETQVGHQLDQVFEK
jgi:hypothetical protein